MFLIQLGHQPLVLCEKPLIRRMLNRVNNSSYQVEVAIPDHQVYKGRASRIDPWDGVRTWRLTVVPLGVVHKHHLCRKRRSASSIAISISATTRCNT
jgi:hypothetical protein